jgi:hypothetical protein
MSRRCRVTDPVLSRPIRWDVIAKPGGVRRVVVLSEADELAFARSVAGAVPAICRALGRGSHANRVVAWDGARGPILEPWRRARRRWQREVRLLAIDAPSVAVTDVRACYASISPGVISDRLRALGAPEHCVDQIDAWLRVFRDVGVDGLPIGPVASAPLAEAVLIAGDDAIRAAGAAHARWVDDVAIFAPDARTRAAAFDALRRAWHSLGLEVHDGKTLLLDTSAAGVHLKASPATSSALR